MALTLDRAWLLRGGGVVLAILVFWGLYEFSPDRQLDRAFSRLIHAAEKRDWKTARTLIADDYRDQWGQDREEAIRLASEVLGQFFFVEIACENLRGERDGRAAHLDARIRLSGRGNALAEAVIRQANSLDGDFRFAWRRKSWKPWDWRLVSTSQPEINSLELP